MEPKRDATWWTCPHCGEHLPDAPQGAGTVVSCECGRRYRFDHWALNRWPGDKGSTGLEPRGL